MPPVPPGNETGVYYIVVSNLTWRTSWQTLKDFARNCQPDGSCINIDHAYVYPGTHSTDGWVRVKGKADFKKALAHLSGGVLEGRALIADGRNEMHTLHLRDLVPAIKTSSTRTRQDSSAAEYAASHSSYQSPDIPQVQSSYSGQESFPEQCYYQQSPITNYQEPPSPAFSTNGSFYSTPPPTYEAAATYSIRPTQEYFTSVPTSNIVYAGNMAPSTPVNVIQIQPVYPCPPPTTIAYTTTQMTTPITASMTTPNMQYPDPTTSATATMASMSLTSTSIAPNCSYPPAPRPTTYPSAIVQPEARKIIITKLSHSIQDADLSALLQRVCSKYKPHTEAEERNPVHSIEILRGSDGKPRGHALVVFESVGLARRAIEVLNREKFMGRVLEARLAKEGVEPVGGYHASAYAGYGMGSQDLGDEYQGQQQYYLPTPPDSSASGSSHGSGKGGKERASDGHGKSKRSEKEKEKERKEKDKDGGAESSRGKSKDKDRREKEKDKERENDRQSKQPMVVDGSGNGKSRRSAR